MRALPRADRAAPGRATNHLEYLMDTQLELFPLSAVTGTGKPRPWPVIVADQVDTDTVPAQAEELPFDADGVQEEAA